MINFTVGPVMSTESVLKIGSEQTPYFRTEEFSDVVFENERLIKDFSYANTDSKVCFITGSGTASMEATVINCFSEKDKVLVIDGGSFGHRFVELLSIHGIFHSIIKPSFGQDITEEDLSEYDGKGYTGFLVNLDETSVGVLYNIELISAFCKRNDLFLVVDSISSFLCDPFNMQALGVQVMITGSQKALACQPGMSIIVLSPEAVERVYNNNPKCMYLDLKLALDNAKRGQTPFTPAVSIMLQINQRLKDIEANGGVESEISRVGTLASYFRNRVNNSDLSLHFASSSMPNAVTSLFVDPDKSARMIYQLLKDEYGIWICPNGGELADKLFRVGHIGALNNTDYDKLIQALYALKDRNVL